MLSCLFIFKSITIIWVLQNLEVQITKLSKKSLQTILLSKTGTMLQLLHVYNYCIN